MAPSITSFAAIAAALSSLCVVVEVVPDLSRALRRRQKLVRPLEAGPSAAANQMGTSDPPIRKGSSRKHGVEGSDNGHDDYEHAPQHLTAHGSSCLDPNGPLPYILMTMGRSGSSSTYQIIGNLTGYETVAEEVPGQNDRLIRQFFDTHPSGQWVLKKLCKKQRRHPDAAAVGFKWKSQPPDAVHIPGFVEALRVVSNATNPPIRVVRSRRNLLDVALSRAKHGNNKKLNLPPHCLEGQVWCIRNHRKAGTGLVLETEGLLDFLTNLTRGEDEVDALLRTMGVRHVSVSYEQLYANEPNDNDEHAEEWTRIFRFLGIGPGDGSLTKRDVRAAMEHVGTSNVHHNETLANYEEVKRLLEGTEHEQLLH